MSYRSICLIAVTITLGLVVLGSAAAQNLLVNPGFEVGPYGDRYEITGWIPVASEERSLFEGIFDASWNNPPPVSSWASNFGPRSGDYYLARYYKTDPLEPAGRGLRGLVAQQITGRSPGETFYASIWLATHLPNGGGVRLGLDPAYEPDPEAAPPPGPTPLTTWFPAEVNEVPLYRTSEAAYSKLNGAATVGAQGTMTLWVEYITVPNNISDVQIVQIDDARLATNKSMEIRNIEVYSISPTVATIVWDTYDGDIPLTSEGAVDYGFTASYGFLKVDTNQRFNHSVNLTGLTTGMTYHLRIRNTASGYEPSATADFTFKHVVAPVISSVADSATGDTATITWTTDIPSDSTVSYGYKAEQYLFTATNPTLTTNHSVTLTGLMPNTAYYYRVTSCAQPPHGCRASAKGPDTLPYVVLTDPGAFWNGDFEFQFGPTHTESEPIPGWTTVTSNTFWFPSGKYEIDAQSGGNYVGSVSQGMRTSACLYQRFATTPGEVLSYAGWLWAEGVALNDDGAPSMAPHRYGEQICKIGIDPTGGISPDSPYIVWSSKRQTQSWRTFMLGDQREIHEEGTQWEKAGVTTVAQGTAATIFLVGSEAFPAGWNFHCFDNIGPEPFAGVDSVAQAKELPIDTLIDLAPAAAADCPVVTYIANPNVDDGDNYGLPYFYIQDSAQPAAIKVTMIDITQELPAWLEVGKRVRVKGSITWGTMRNRYGGHHDLQIRLDKPAGERAIRAIEVTDAGVAGVIEPVALTNRSVGTGGSEDAYFTNAGAAGAPGTHNIGIVVRVVGKVTGFGDTQEGMKYLVIDDGSTVTGYSGYPTQLDQRGLAVYTSIFDYSDLVGSYVEVTGIAGVRVDNDFDDPVYLFPGVSESGKNVRWIKPLPDESFLPSIRVLD